MKQKTPRTLTVGVTGGAGSGKTTVCSLLRQSGFPVISTDRIAREVVSPGSAVLRAVVERFGDRILKPDGTLDRSLLREIMVNDPYQKQILEDILHPAILKRMQDGIHEARRKLRPIVVVEVPLLFELDLADAFDCIVMVHTDRKRKIDRIVLRDDVRRQSAEALVDTQLPDRQKIEHSDIIIENNGSPEALKKSVHALVRTLLEKGWKGPEKP